jgi:hypothetical protein
MNCEACLKTWNIYQSAWGPIDEAARQRLLQESVAVDGIYTDPFPRSTELKHSQPGSGSRKRNFLALISATTASSSITARACSTGPCTIAMDRSSSRVQAMAVSERTVGCCR